LRLEFSVMFNNFLSNVINPLLLSFKFANSELPKLT